MTKSSDYSRIENNHYYLVDNFSKNLSYLLDKTQTKQAVLAKEIGTSQNVISQLKSGTKEPSFKLFLRICDAFKVSPDMMLYHDIKKEREGFSYTNDIAAEIYRPTTMPECVISRYCNIRLYMYYYTIENDSIYLREGNIQTFECINNSFIKSCITTATQQYNTKLVIDYPHYGYFFGINSVNLSRCFIMFSDPTYEFDQMNYQGGLAISCSEIPEGHLGLPGMQFVALSPKRVDLLKYENALREFLTVPKRSRLLRLHRSINHNYIKWLNSI